jgi:hypothetical protein
MKPSQKDTRGITMALTTGKTLQKGSEKRTHAGIPIEVTPSGSSHVLQRLPIFKRFYQPCHKRGHGYSRRLCGEPKKSPLGSTSLAKSTRTITQETTKMLLSVLRGRLHSGIKGYKQSERFSIRCRCALFVFTRKVYGGKISFLIVTKQAMLRN